jgi:hypothetical protein
MSFSHYYSRNMVSNLPLMDHTHSRTLLEVFGGETTELVLRFIGDCVQTWPISYGRPVSLFAFIASSRVLFAKIS